MSATRFYPSLQPQGIREDVVARLRAARFGPKAPIGAEGDAWRMGTSDAALRHIVDHWLTVRGPAQFYIGMEKERE